MQSIITEDGVTVHEGDHVYNYYDMWPGHIVAGTVSENGRKEGEALNLRRDLWFDVKRSNGGGTSLLNGERICSIPFAQRKGWPGV